MEHNLICNLLKRYTLTLQIYKVFIYLYSKTDNLLIKQEYIELYFKFE